MASCTLHYIYDPYCGWCYAAAPLLAEVEALPQVELMLRGGGLVADQQVTAAWRERVLRQDQHIARLTGQRFGDAYLTGLLHDEATVFDSSPPTAAILAATQLGRGWQMLCAVQRAHFEQGRRVADPGELARLAAALGLDARAFEDAYAGWAGEPVREHFAQSRALLKAADCQGLPGVVLSVSGQPDTLLHLEPFLGRPAAWVDYLLSVAAQRV